MKKENNNLGAFIARYLHVIVFVLLEVVAILLIVQNSVYQRSRIVRWGNAIAGSWHKGVSGVTGYFRLKAENEHLAAENASLRAQLASSYISYIDSVFVVNDTVYKQRYSYTDALVIKNSYNKAKNYHHYKAEDHYNFHKADNDNHNSSRYYHNSSSAPEKGKAGRR